MNTETLIGSTAVCRRLQIHPGTLSRWVSAGRITPALRLEGKTGAFLFHEEEVARVEQLRAAEPAKEASA